MNFSHGKFVLAPKVCGVLARMENSMKDFIRITDLSRSDIKEIFCLADELSSKQQSAPLVGKTVVLFFPATSIRTRVTFEKGISLLGGQSILFAPETLDKREDLRDVCGYLSNWADLLVVRHQDIGLIERMSEYSRAPVVNAMTSENHPCEVLSDIYSLSKIRKDYLKKKYLFCGTNSNIGRSWKEAAEVLSLDLSQCCALGYEIPGLKVYHKIEEAIQGKDIICTDSIPTALIDKFNNCQVSLETMKLANAGAVLNPCPPFFRGEEVTEEVIDSEYFVNYTFKKSLLEVQQAVLLFLLKKNRKST